MGNIVWIIASLKYKNAFMIMKLIISFFEENRDFKIFTCLFVYMFMANHKGVNENEKLLGLSLVLTVYCLSKRL